MTLCQDIKKLEKLLTIISNQILLIPGVEISTTFEGSNIHLLGYFFDVKNTGLNDILKQLQLRRIEFAKYVLNNLKKEEGFNIQLG